MSYIDNVRRAYGTAIAAIAQGGDFDKSFDAVAFLRREVVSCERDYAAQGSTTFSEVTEAVLLQKRALQGLAHRAVQVHEMYRRAA